TGSCEAWFPRDPSSPTCRLRRLRSPAARTVPAHARPPAPKPTAPSLRGRPYSPRAGMRAASFGGREGLEERIERLARVFFAFLEAAAVPAQTAKPEDAPGIELDQRGVRGLEATAWNRPAKR